MRMGEARAKIAVISKGEYHSVRIEVTQVTSKITETSVRLYIHNRGGFYGQTFEEAFSELDKSLRPKKKQAVNHITIPKKANRA